METSEFILDLETEAEPLNEKTRAIIENALVQGLRGETVTFDEAIKSAQENYQTWLKAQKEALPASSP